MRTEDAVIYLCSCAINGIAPEKEKVEQMDLTEVYRFGSFHMLGAILAMANLPDYDLNDPFNVLYPQLTDYFRMNGTDSEKEDPVAAARVEQWKNKSIADFYYPGSVFKVFLVSGAYEEGVIDETTTYDCVGTINIADRTIKDFNPTGHGLETPRTLLVNSCNTFAVTVGRMMGQEL